MVKQEFSATRTHATWKPRVTEADIPLFHCPECGHVYQGITDGSPLTFSGTGRSLVAELPFQNVAAPLCPRCGKPLESIPFIEHDNLPDGIELDFQFRGGFNNNCVKIKWDIRDTARYQLQWVLIKTFTGSQLKYVHEKKYSPLTFAFADEDAYCYCDSDPCEECMFRCKFGMCAYCFIMGLGLVHMPFDRMLASGSGARNEGMRRSKR